MKRLYIEIVGGLVSAVYTDSGEKLDVWVIDRDCSEEDAEYYDPDYAEDMKRVSNEIAHDKTLVPIY
jgi:hypothetical protein